MRTYARVDRRILTENYASIRRAVGPRVAILAVVKADAYGHGAVEVARALARAGASHFAVACLEEGIELRQAGIEGGIVVMGGAVAGDEKALREHRLTPLIQTAEQLRNWDREAALAQTELPYHIELDTGMNRLGIETCPLDQLAAMISGAKHLQLEGLASHLASAEDFGNGRTGEQLERFEFTAGELARRGIRARYLHLANSAAIAYRPETSADMVRPGLALYGYVNRPCGQALASRLQIRPALEWRARILAVRRVELGAQLGYDGAYRADRVMRVAVLSVGYGDGLDRRMSNGGEVLVRGLRCPIVGLVSMDVTLVDVSAVSGAAPGDEAVLIGNSLDAWVMAERCNSIPYEVLCRISKRVTRVYY